MIKKSLSRQLIVVFSGILIAVLLLNIIINSLLLKQVYRQRRIDVMVNSYNSLYAQYKNDADESKIIDTVKEILKKDNLRVFIWDKDNNLIIDSLPLSPDNNDNDEKQPPDTKEPFGKFREPRRAYRYDRTELFLYYMDIKSEHKIDENECYLLFSFTSLDKYEDDEMFCLRSLLPKEYKLLIQMPISPIDDAAALSNTLLSIVGVLMLIIGIIIVSVTSRSIAKPVKELSSIAKSMENLDFSKKYNGGRCDEIGSLGESINSLSTKLETTINELYDKNKHLENDIELKSRIDTMRKEFIANASHELKTPLALISGYAEGLRDNVADDDEAREAYTEVIIEEAAKMNAIIHQMLDLMELDSAEAVPEARAVSLTEITLDVLSSFELMLSNKQITLKKNIEEDVIVFGDYIRIYQAVSNYVSNAVNHVNENKLIEVTLKTEDDKAVFSVFNTSTAISDEDLMNIWERFYKIDKAHTRSYGGSGLGLSIVKSIIELHNGDYGVKNINNGVEFYFSIKNRP